MKRVVAVSGGVDSVVLLDMLHKKGEDRLIVAHVDHGIRAESADDEVFVRALARRYSLPYASIRYELGKGASEEKAREVRYDFLRSLADKHGAVVTTAHHQDDCIETIAINCARGTGWRGVAVMGGSDVSRPLLGISKQQIYDYAIKNKLEWVEDATNHQDVYLRNRMRRALALRNVDTRTLMRLRADQLTLRTSIERLIGHLSKQFGDRRHPYIMSDEHVAIELLNQCIKTAVSRSLTRPQLLRALHMMKVARPGKRYEVGQGVIITFSSDRFVVSQG